MFNYITNLRSLFEDHGSSRKGEKAKSNQRLDEVARDDAAGREPVDEQDGDSWKG